MAERRAQTWPVPFCRQLQGELVPGQSLFVQGFLIGDQRFDVNMSAGPNAISANPTDEIPLHVSCRIKEGAIVCNSFQGGKWGDKEERKKCPFKKAEEFDIRIRAHDDHFEIFANGKELMEYHFRVAISHVNYVCIWGDVELHRVSWEGRYYPMPFQTALSEGFRPGKALYVSGVINEKANRFAFNFLTRNGDNAFHLNVRFDEKKVVRNSQIGGAWDKVEEREGPFPFQKGRTFDIIVQSQNDGYYVFVDGQPYCSYKHRMNVADVEAITIEGDVELQGVHW